jgi:hypothetical protein
MTTPIIRFSYNKRPSIPQRFIFFGFMPIGIAPVPTFVFSQYLFLEDHYINGNYIPAGTIASNADLLPAQWVPTPNVDPLNTGAVNAFYAAGPGIQGPVRTQFTPLPVRQPVTYWRQVGPDIWALTGLGSNQSTYPPKGGL